MLHLCCVGLGPYVFTCVLMVAIYSITLMVPIYSITLLVPIHSITLVSIYMNKGAVFSCKNTQRH